MKKAASAKFAKTAYPPFVARDDLLFHLLKKLSREPDE